MNILYHYFLLLLSVVQYFAEFLSVRIFFTFDFLLYYIYKLLRENYI